LFACDTLLPNCGPLPQASHRFAIVTSWNARILLAIGGRPARTFHGGQRPPLNLNQGDCFDLDLCIARQSRCLHRCSRRRVFAKEAAVDFIHCRKVIHVRQKNRRLDNLFQARLTGLQNRGKVPHHLFSLFGNSARNKFSRRRVNRNLSRAEQQIAGANRLRIRPDCARRLVGSDNFSQSTHRQRSGCQNKPCTLADSCIKCETARTISSLLFRPTFSPRRKESP